MVYVFRLYIDIYNVIYISFLLCCSFSCFHAFNARLLSAGYLLSPSRSRLSLPPFPSLVSYAALLISVHIYRLYTIRRFILYNT